MRIKNLFIKVILSSFIICSTTLILVRNIQGVEDPFGLVLIGFPLSTLLTSLILQLLIKNKVIILSVFFIAYLIATFTVFNSSFLIYCPIYTVIGLYGTSIADDILNFKK